MNEKLLKEFQDYQPPFHMRSKAHRVWRKAKKAGKHDLAARIDTKYLQGEGPGGDMVVAFGMCMMAESKVDLYKKLKP